MEEPQQPGELDAVRTWLEQGRALRESLLAQRDDARRKLAEIEAAIAQLPPESITPIPPVVAAEEPTSEGDETTLPAKVMALLRSSPVGRSSVEVHEALQATGVRATRATVHSTLYRLAKAKQILQRGVRGSYLYSTKPSFTLRRKPGG